MPQLKKHLLLKTRSWDTTPLHFCFHFCLPDGSLRRCVVTIFTWYWFLRGVALGSELSLGFPLSQRNITALHCSLSSLHSNSVNLVHFHYIFPHCYIISGIDTMYLLEPCILYKIPLACSLCITKSTPRSLPWCDHMLNIPLKSQPMDATLNLTFTFPTPLF